MGIIEPRVSISIETQFAEIFTLEISWSYIYFSSLPSLFLGKAFSTFTLGGFDSVDKTSVNHKEYQSLLKLVAPAKRKKQRGKEKYSRSWQRRQFNKLNCMHCIASVYLQEPTYSIKLLKGKK